MLTESLVRVLEKSYIGWDCPCCGRLPLAEVKQVERDETCLYACLKCDREPELVSKPRIIDLTEPMVVIQSVVVTEEMRENNEIPY